ncbi:MAG: OmpA family protein [Pseudomonadales bacterium]
MRLGTSLPLLALLLLAGCANLESDPSQLEANPNLEQARAAYHELRDKKQLSKSGAEALAEAEKALVKAEQLHNRKVKTELVDGYAQLSLRLSSVALEKQSIVEARERLSNATKEMQQQQVVPASLKSQNGGDTQNGLQESQDGRGQVLTIGDVLFEFNTAELSPAGEKAIERIAGILQQYPDRNILIEGYTDNSGSAAVNRNISQQRAENVKRALVELGAAEEKIGAIGLGEYYPIADNGSNEGRIKNRRVEVIIPPS